MVVLLLLVLVLVLELVGAGSVEDEDEKEDEDEVRRRSLAFAQKTFVHGVNAPYRGQANWCKAIKPTDSRAPIQGGAFFFLSIYA